MVNTIMYMKNNETLWIYIWTYEDYKEYLITNLALICSLIIIIK